jgi:threonine dehydratase
MTPPESTASGDDPASDFSASTFEDARRRIGDRVHRTPLTSATLLGRRAGVDLRLKCENLQKTGSFKVRGALNFMLQLDDEAREYLRGIGGTIDVTSEPGIGS